MSLMRLLAAGSSLRGIKDRRSPYKMTQQHLLPKFGPKEGDPVPLSADPRPTLRSIPSSAADRLPVAEPPGETIGSPTNMNLNRPEVHTSVASPDAGEKPKMRRAFWPWMRRRNPFQPKQALKQGSGPVQGELMLERVKVVRNDLHEADLELVSPIAGAGAAQPAGRASAAPEAARVAWQRITARLFGVRRT